MYEKIDSDGFLNSEYCDNVDLFLDFAFANDVVVDTRVNIHGETIREIKCPCYKCQNISYRDRSTVQKHLYKEGFMLCYETWSEHGENSIKEVGQCSTTMEVDDNDDGYRRMVLDNMYESSYTLNTLEGEEPNPEAKRFYDMLQAADEPLWEGEKATRFSKLQAATSFLTWKSLFYVSNAAYNYNISMVNALLPEENKLPKNFYETKKSLEKLSLPYERIDVCKNHCTLFYKQDKALTQWATYNENENDYYGLLDEILELEYHSTIGRCVVVLFKCVWFDPVKGVRVDPKTHIVDVKPTTIGCIDDPFILASQAQQVYYVSYPSNAKELKGWLAVVKTTPRGVYELSHEVSEMDDDDIADREHFFQENERIECTITEDLLPISFLHDDGMLEEVEDFDEEDFEYHGTHYGSSGIDSNDIVLPSFIEGNDDDDDESTFHGAHTRRGHASQVQVPEPINREWIWIEDGEFSNQEKATRIIGVILKAMWNGPWDSWRDVPNEDRTRLFERFQACKFPDFLRRVRNEAKETARKQGLLVGDDMLVLIDYKPPWIRTEIWKKMIDIWNAPEWKAKSQRNTDIKSKSIGGKHTLGSQSYMTAKRKAAKILGRELQPHEMWKQSHCRKGSRPMDKDLSSSSSHVSDVDSEENIEEDNLVWVDERAKETWAKYDGYLVEKYGDERSNHPKFDEVLWSRAAGGKNKRKVYGLSCVNDSNAHGRQNHEVC
ncbi:hypothetical protein E3N88_22949 [Mikania micrantha]|uniref:Transposase-associated domain-containing protein n=1 Tax=Mikania micrantha TaxID=192012 RepID=A0A5N6NEE6_9ASTR|nr:hypothetical protein E3N88_22949 [Mikania micrantha]